MNPFEFILKNKLIPIFISPHIDDAIFSCGDLINRLKNDGLKPEIINVFTEVSSPPESKFAKEYIRSCGYSDSRVLFSERKAEEKELLKKLNIKSKNLNFVDAAWRKKQANKFIQLVRKFYPKNLFFYPDGKAVFSGRISVKDRIVTQKIKSKLNFLINKKNVIFFGPLGIGLHTDHLIVREICQKNLKRVVYWSDFPYSINNQADSNFILMNGLSSFEWETNFENKIKLIKSYKSQINSLFPGGKIQVKNEIYYFNPKVLQSY